MRALISLCLRRPVTVAACYALAAVLAAVAFVRLPVALLPDLRYPALSVWTAYPDVPPERVERAVTEPVEAAVAGTQGVLRVTSESRLGGSLVRMEFGWNADLDVALLDVREQLDRLGDVLPDAALRPLVLRLDPSDRPILVVALREATPAGGAVRATRQDLVGLKEVGREVVARRIEQLDDVARVRLGGGYERRVEVAVDPARFAAHGLDVEGVEQALRQANVALPGGVVRRGPFRYAVEVSGEFQSLDEIGATVVSSGNAPPVRLRDVADVRDAVAERSGLVRLDGAETLLLLVERRPDANTVRAAAQVRQVLRQLEADVPGVALEVVVDESQFVEQAIGGVVRAVLLGGLLAVGVLFVFLRRPRALAAVAVSVPLSLGLTLVLFELLGVTFNLISLSGLALGMGMLVDNAIVVVENIARLREKGVLPGEAARAGTLEVAGAITSSTLTTLAVFLPLTFVEGLAGRLFRDQSLAVVCSLLASLVVALTAVPLVAARERVREKDGAGRRRSPLLAPYERALGWCLDHRAAVLAGSFVLLVATALVALRLPREVVPPTDQGQLGVHLTLSPDADLARVSLRAAEIENGIAHAHLARHILADLGARDDARLETNPRLPYEADLTLVLSDSLDVGTALARIRTLPLPADVQVEVTPVRTQLENLLAPEAADLFIDLAGTRRADAEAAVGGLLEKLRACPELAGVRRRDAAEVPAYRLTFRRDALARFGVEATTISSVLEAAARGLTATALRTVGEEIPIVLRTPRSSTIEMLLATRVPAHGALLPLGTFVEAEAVTLPATLLRSGQTPVVRLVANVAAGSDLAGAVAAIEAVLAEAGSAGVRGEVGGANEAFRSGLAAIGWSLLLSVLLVYLILAAQFESLVQPLVILATVPLAAAGVALTLALTGHSLNLMSLTGCVVLVGIVVNDAIVKVDFINRRRADGLSLRESVISAGHERVRPILMTTATTVLGLLPLALGLGKGAALQAPLAVAIAGGLTAATLLTLFVVPVLYMLLVPGRKKVV